ncbi:unnamed protein product [Rhodiola kirilowii]
MTESVCMAFRVMPTTKGAPPLSSLHFHTSRRQQNGDCRRMLFRLLKIRIQKNFHSGEE